MSFLVYIWVFLFGLICGSFINVLIYRIPRGVFFKMGSRSHCPFCGEKITWIDNIPILSFLFLGGKCRYCKAPISFRYPFIEMLTSFCFLWIAWRFFNKSGMGLEFGIGGAILTVWLITASGIDAEHKILPDIITIPGIIVSPLIAFCNPYGMGFISKTYPGALGIILGSIAGIVVGSGIIWVLGVFGEVIFKKEAMGFGDVKFMGFLGGVLGPEGTLLAIIIASFVGAIIGGIATWKTKDKYIPFGPFLALGGFVVFTSKGLLIEFFSLLNKTNRKSLELGVFVVIITLILLFLLVILKRLKSKTQH